MWSTRCNVRHRNSLKGCLWGVGASENQEKYINHLAYSGESLDKLLIQFISQRCACYEIQKYIKHCLTLQRWVFFTHTTYSHVYMDIEPLGFSFSLKKNGNLELFFSLTYFEQLHWATLKFELASPSSGAPEVLRSQVLNSVPRGWGWDWEQHGVA